MASACAQDCPAGPAGPAGDSYWTESNGTVSYNGNVKLTGTLIGGSAATSIQTLKNGMVYVNTSPRKLLVTAFEGATPAVHDLEGRVGSGATPDTLVASESGTDRMSITFVVPPGHSYSVTSNSGNGVNLAQVWEL